jgi:hypothetical protein
MADCNLFSSLLKTFLMKTFLMLFVLLIATATTAIASSWTLTDSATSEWVVVGNYTHTDAVATDIGIPKPSATSFCNVGFEMNMAPDCVNVATVPPLIATVASKEARMCMTGDVASPLISVANATESMMSLVGKKATCMTADAFPPDIASATSSQSIRVEKGACQLTQEVGKKPICTDGNMAMVNNLSGAAYTMQSASTVAST